MSAPRNRADELLEMWSSATARPVPAFEARPRRRRSTVSRRWVALVVVVVAALIVGLVALAGGSSIPPTPQPTPSPSISAASLSPAPSASAAATFPTAVDGLTVQSVSELLAARASGQAKGGPYALRGYWTDRNFLHSCVPPPPGEKPGELELRCIDGEWGITELDESILDVNFETGQQSRAKGPHLTPYMVGIHDTSSPPPDVVALFGSLLRPPVPIVVVGHFDDPLAADCRKAAQQLCLDRFVIDRVAMFDPNSVPAPTPSPTPTPFPLSDPPPALLTDARCYTGVPKKFTGWIPLNDLHVGAEGPGYVYAMVTRDVVPIGEWWDNPSYPGHKTRAWGQGVCWAREFDADITYFGAVTGTTYVEVDDGRHIATSVP